MMQAQNGAAMAAAAAQAAAAAADWRNVVPDAEERSFVTTKLVGGAQTLEYGTAPAPKPKPGAAPAPQPAPPTITPERQLAIDAACKRIADFRATLPLPAATGGNNSNQGARWAGTWWTRGTAMRELKPPKATKKDPTPADPRTDEQKAGYDSAVSYDAWLRGVGTATGTRALPAAGEDTAPYLAWLKDRLFLDIAGLEGGTDSINVYDKQIVTWGGGLGGTSGAVPAALQLVAGSTRAGGGHSVGTEVTRLLLAAGIDFGTNAAGAVEFVVCDPGAKRKFRGDSALHLIKADNRLLMLLTSISRGDLPGVDVDTAGAPAAPGGPAGETLREATRRAVYDAQKSFFVSGYNTGDFGRAIATLGATWPYDSMMMVLHLEWWGVSRWTQYQATGGDMTKIIKRAFELYKSYVTTRNGASVGLRDFAHHMQHFGGASSEACWGPEAALPDDQLEAAAFYVETKPAVAFKAAVPDTVKDGKVVTKGKPEVAAENARYRKLK